MPQFMPQVSTLPVDVSQSTDFKSEKSFKGSKGSEGESQRDSFSALVDRHLSSDKSGNEKQKITENGNKTSTTDSKPTSTNKQDNSEVNEDSSTMRSSTGSEDSSSKEVSTGNSMEKSVDEKTTPEKTAIHPAATGDEAEITDEIDVSTLAKFTSTPEAAIAELEMSEKFLSLLASSKEALNPSIANKDKLETSTLDELGITDEKALLAKLKSNGDLISDADKKEQLSKTGITNAEQSETLAKGKVLPNEVLAKSITDAIKKEQLSLVAQSDNQSVANEPDTSESDALALENDNGLALHDKGKVTKDISNGLLSKTNDKAGLTPIELQKIQASLQDESNGEQTLLSNAPSEISENERDQLAAERPLNVTNKDNTHKENHSVGQQSMSNAKLSTTTQQSSVENELLTALKTKENESMLTPDKVEHAIAASGVKNPNVEQGAQLKSSQPAKALDVLQSQILNESEASSENSSDANQEELTQEQINQQIIANKAADNVNELGVKPSSFEKVMANLPPSQLSTGTALNSQTAAANMTESSQVVLEEMTNTIVSENITQAKNNAVTLSETISIFRKDFAEAVKDKVMVLISQKLQQFDIQLDPPELGNVHVRVNLQNEQAVVNFTVQNQQAKEAFEENLGKLKEMLSEKGVDVGDANVKQQSQNAEDGENTDNHNGFANHDKNNADEISDEQVFSGDLYESSATGVDYYA